MAVILWRGIRRSQSKARRHHPGHRERHGLQGRLVHLVRLAHQRRQVAGLRCHFMPGSGSRPTSRSSRYAVGRRLSLGVRTGHARLN